MIEPSGSVAAGFEAVRAAFVSNFTDRGDVGAAVSVYIGGEPVVDLWGGEAAPGRPWQEDTMALVFSTTKGPTITCVQLLADRGRLDIDAPVADYWPEFAAAGKQDITVRQVLTHRSGVITFPNYQELLDLEDHWASSSAITERLAAAAPTFAPGTRHGYHALTFGWILGEVVERITGRTIGTFFRDEIAEPLGLDFWIGLPESEHHRVAELRDAPPPTDPTVAAYLSMFNADSWTGRAHFVGPHGLGAVADSFNSAEVRSAEIPAGGGVGTACSLARLYAMLAGKGSLDGVDLLSPGSIEAFAADQVAGPDAVLIYETRYALGYMRPTELFPLGPNDEAFGHGGLGGSLAFADPIAGVGFGYVPNQLLFPSLDEPTRARSLVDAVYACL